MSRLRWTHVDEEKGQLHVDVHTYTDVILSLHAKKLAFLCPNFFFERNKKWKFSSI